MTPRAGGGFIPARILRTFLKQQSGKSIPIQAIGLILYNDDLDGGDFDPSTVPVRKTQWLNYRQSEANVSLQGHNILIVDEVDDSRKTLSYAVAGEHGSAPVQERPPSFHAGTWA